MTNNEAVQVKSATNLFAETGRYFQVLPKASQRKAVKLAEHFAEVERIFLWTKGETK